MPSSPNDRPIPLIFGLILVVALWIWSLSWNEPILDRHEFRQTQTAISAFWMKQEGGHLNYETPLFGPPWSVPFEFPVYQWCAAQLSRTTGLALEQSGRAISILFLLATLPAVFFLAGLARLSRSGCLLVVACVLTCPVYLYYGRTFMIETTALCFSTWFVLATGLAVRDLKLRWSILAAICGVLAALSKITTFAIYCFPAAGLVLVYSQPYWQSRRQGLASLRQALIFSVTPLLCAVGISEWWIRHTDTVKAANPFSINLNSIAMKPWVWGSLDQRFSSAVWREFWTNLSGSISGVCAMVVLLICLVLVKNWHRGWAAAGAVCFLLGPLLFTNLYFYHDYYYSANALLLMLGGGILLAAMWATSTLPRGAKLTLLVLFYGSQLFTFYRTFGRYHLESIPRPPEIADVIRQTVPGDGVVLYYGWDWNSLLPYYSERRALMAPKGREYDFRSLDQILLNLPPRRIVAMVVYRQLFDAAPAFIAERTARFGLAPTPFATSQAGELYLPRKSFDEDQARLAGQNFSQVEFPPGHAIEPEDDGLKSSDMSAVDFSLFSPAPVQLRSLLGFANIAAHDQPAILAHSPSEIWFQPPANTSHLSAEFGLLEGSYTGAPPLTEGIGVTILEVQPAGAPPRILFRRALDPAGNPQDRGMQKIELTNIGPLTGQLIFRMDTGANGISVKDWAYWAKIEIR